MTGSFVGTILEHAGQMEQKCLQDKLELLQGQLSELEAQVWELAHAGFVNFQPNLARTRALVQGLQQLQDQMTSLEQIMDAEMKGPLAVTTEEIHKLSEEKFETKVILSGLKHLAEIYQLFELFQRSLESSQYKVAAQTLSQLALLFEDPICSKKNKIQIFEILRAELMTQQTRMDYLLSDLWKETIQWNVLKSNEAVWEISLSCRDKPAQLMKALAITGLLHKKMQDLATLFQHFLVPFITVNLNPIITKKTFHTTQTLTISTGSETDSSRQADVVADTLEEDKVYSQVFSNLLTILEYLDSMFLHIRFEQQLTATVDKSTIVNTGQSSPCTETRSLMSLLGEMVSPWLLDLLTKTLLAKAVPSSARDLEGFSSVVHATHIFHERLLELGFLDSENQTLPRYVEDVHLLFANKKSQETLETAHSLMKAELHDSVAITDDKPIGEWPPLIPGGVKKGQRAELTPMIELSENTFRMPKCRISVNVQALVTQAYQMMQEAAHSSPQAATQITYAVRNIFEMFCYVVPVHHSQNLVTYPQLSALHHNNCMFLAHHLMTLGIQFSPKLPSKASKSFLDLIQMLRQNGLQVFSSQVKRQQSILLEHLSGAEGFRSLMEESGRQRSEKAVKQVMLLLSHLHKVWKPVLPTSLYQRTMGQLLDGVVQAFTKAVISLEDIGQQESQQLLLLLTLLEQDAAELLTSPGEVASAQLLKHVPSWSRLMEMKFMLAASLTAIGDRWADGQGPLAVSFTPVEVKQMVRALFQNTDRRAALLTTIK